MVLIQTFKCKKEKKCKIYEPTGNSNTMELRNFLKCDIGFAGSGVNLYLLEIHTEIFKYKTIWCLGFISAWSKCERTVTIKRDGIYNDNCCSWVTSISEFIVFVSLLLYMLDYFKIKVETRFFLITKKSPPFL